MDNVKRLDDRWPYGDSDMAAHIRAHDWSSTPLKARDRWPAELRCAVDLVLASPIVASVVVGPHRVLIYNDAAAALYGDKHPAALGRPVSESWPDAWAQTAHLYERVFAGESIHVPAQPLDLERTNAGQVFDAYLIPVRGPDGAVIAAHMNGFEVGIRLQAETALKSNEEKYRTLFETMGQGYCDLELLRDADGRAVDQRYLELNPAYERLIGISVAQAKGRTASEVMPGLEPWWTKTFDRIAKQGEPERIEYQVASLGRWFEVFAYPRGGDRLTVLYEDITERKRAEQALSASEAQLRAFVSATSDVIYRMSPDWKEMRQLDGRGFLADTKAPTIRWWDEYIFPEDRTHIQSVIEKAIEAKGPFELEHRVRRLDGTEGWTFSRAIPVLAADGRIVDWFGTAQDISPRQRAEAVLRESEERQAFLLRFSDALRAAPSADAVADLSIRMLSEQMELDRCYITFYRPEDDRADFPYQVGNDQVPALPDTVRLSDFSDAYRQVLGKTFVVEDDFERRGLSEAEKRNSQRLGMRALLASTLRKGEDNPLSSLAAVSARPRRWTQGEIALVEEVAERTWAAMERARAEVELHESEARLSRALEAGELGAWELDLSTLEAWRSPQHDRIFGHETMLSEWTYDMFLEHVVSEDRDRVDAAFQAAVTGGDRWDFECRIRRADGEERWIWAQGTVEPGADGAPRRVKGMVRDVTERRAVEERQAFLLRLSDALRPIEDPLAIRREASRVLRSHLGAARVAYAEMHEDGMTTTLMSEELAEGTPPLPQTTLSWSDFYPEGLAALNRGQSITCDDVRNADLPASRKAMFAALGIHAFAVAPLVKSGRMIASLFVHFDQPHPSSSHAIALQEETAERTWAAIERARAESASRESEARLAAAFESVPVGVAVIDRFGGTVIANGHYRRFLPSGVIPSRGPGRLARWRSWDSEGRPLEPGQFSRCARPPRRDCRSGSRDALCRRGRPGAMDQRRDRADPRC